METRTVRLVGILIVLVPILATVYLQIEKWIDLLANLTDLWLFVVLVPSLSFGINLILKGAIPGIAPSRSKTTPHELDPNAPLSPLSSSVKVFEVGILPEKTQFHRGQFLMIRMKFEGTLRYGYRAALAIFPDKTTIPIYDLTTLPDIYSKGTLDGYKSFDEQWPWRVPVDAPIGTCELFVAPCTQTKDVTLYWKVRRWPLRLLDPRRPDLAKPERQAVKGETIRIDLVE